VTSLADVKSSIVPLPESSDTTIVIRVTHVSPTHVDMLYARGQHQNNRRHAKPPFILGTDFAGVVVRLPQSGTSLTIGDRVYGSHFGAFAEYISIDPKVGSGSIRKVPKVWTSAEACAVGSSGATSLGCFLTAGGIQKGSWILVTGASGGLGIIACQIAKARGAKVIALVGDDEKREVLRRLGVDACVSYTKKAWEREVFDITRDGVDLVYDAVGMVESSLKCCKFGGKVVIVGFAGRGGQMEEVKMNRILLKGAAVIGYVSSSRIENASHRRLMRRSDLANSLVATLLKQERSGSNLTTSSTKEPSRQSYTMWIIEVYRVSPRRYRTLKPERFGEELWLHCLMSRMSSIYQSRASEALLSIRRRCRVLAKRLQSPRRSAMNAAMPVHKLSEGVVLVSSLASCPMADSPGTGRVLCGENSGVFAHIPLFLPIANISGQVQWPDGPVPEGLQLAQR
jgi:NADPH2:quinone reductase